MLSVKFVRLVHRCSMLIQATILKNLPVASIEDQAKIGHVDGLIIDPKNGKIEALQVKPNLLFSKNKILSTIDIVETDSNGLVTKNQENLVVPEEIIRVREILTKKIPVLGQIAVTESGNKLGHINDLLIDSESWMILKYYVKSAWEDRILAADKIVKITEKAVIFTDDVIEKTPVVEPEGAAA